MSLTTEQQRIVDAVIERAEQACRYVWKHQDMEASLYATGFEIACGVCEKAIRDAVMRHIEDDLRDAASEPTQEKK